MQDIGSKDDLAILVNAFYGRVKGDEVIGPVFNAIIGNDWSRHLPVMYTFWNTVLFGEEGYKGQAVARHMEIDRAIPLRPAHFERWISLWRSTVDACFAGPNAARIKEKAAMMLQLIQFKVAASRSGKSLL